MQESSMELLWRSSHIAGGNATYVEDLYESYLKDPNGVPEQWRDYFDKLPLVESQYVQLEDVPHSVIRDRFAKISKMRVRTEATVQHDSQATEYERKQVRVVQLVVGLIDQQSDDHQSACACGDMRPRRRWPCWCWWFLHWC